MMSEDLKVAIIGCGYWGPNLVRNFTKIPGVKVEAICDRVAARRDHVAGIYPEVDTYADFQTLLDHALIDAVVVATPLRSHFEIAKAALLKGKNVLLEKPMASSVEECQELISIAAERKLILMVGHTHLYSDPIQKIKEIISGGEIGELRYVNSQRLSLGMFQEDMNVVWDLAPHDLSIICEMVGELPTVVNCQGSAHVNPEVEDVANISLQFPKGSFATIQNSWLEPRKVRQITFVGTKKTVIYDDLQPREKIRILDVSVERPPHYDTFGDFHYAYHYGDTYIPRVEQTEPLGKMCRHFLDCIRSGSTPLTSGASGLEVVRVLEALTESMTRKGAPIAYSGSYRRPLAGEVMSETSIGLVQ